MISAVSAGLHSLAKSASNSRSEPASPFGVRTTDFALLTGLSIKPFSCSRFREFQSRLFQARQPSCSVTAAAPEQLRQSYVHRLPRLTSSILYPLLARIDGISPSDGYSRSDVSLARLARPGASATSRTTRRSAGRVPRLCGPNPGALPEFLAV